MLGFFYIMATIQTKNEVIIMNYIEELKRIREQLFQVAWNMIVNDFEYNQVSIQVVELDKIILDLENRENNHETKN